MQIRIIFFIFFIFLSEVSAQQISKINSHESIGKFSLTSIGEIKGDFYKSIDVVFLGEKIVLFDKGNNTLHIYNFKFEKEKTIPFKEGNGPGELNGRGRLYANEKYILINRGNSLLLFNEDGVFLREKRGLFFYTNIVLNSNYFDVCHYTRYRGKNTFLIRYDFEFNVLKKHRNKNKRYGINFYNNTLDDLRKKRQVSFFLEHKLSFAFGPYEILELNSNGVTQRKHIDEFYDRPKLKSSDLIIPKVTGTTKAESAKMQLMVNTAYEKAFEGKKPAINKILGSYENYLFVSLSIESKNLLKFDILEWKKNQFFRIQTVDIKIENIQPNNIERLIKAKIENGKLIVITSSDDNGPYVKFYKILKN